MRTVLIAACLLIAVVLLSTAVAQSRRTKGQVPPGPRPPQQAIPPGGPGAEAQGSPDQQPAYPPLPSDQRLLALHIDFVKKAMGLAAEYERGRQSDKAAAVYGEILKLVPAHAKARQMLEKLQEREAGANRTTFNVHANRDWQDTGIRCVPGKAVRLTASGKWTFKMSHELGPEGMDIPEVLRDFKLGSLIGVIKTDDPQKNKPFFIGDGTEFVAEQAGPLLVRMHDSDPSDNQGRIVLEMSGQFQK